MMAEVKIKMKNKELERRSYNFEVRAEETEAGNIITGRPIVYNSRTDLGWFDEIIEPGALNNTDLTDVRFLVNHDTSKIPLARSMQKYSKQHQCSLQRIMMALESG